MSSKRDPTAVLSKTTIVSIIVILVLAVAGVIATVIVLYAFPSSPSTPEIPVVVNNRDCVLDFDPEKWSDCSTACGHGTQTNTAVVILEPLGTGKPCPPLIIERQCDVDCQRSLFLKSSLVLGSIDPNLFNGEDRTGFTVGLWVMLSTPNVGSQPLSIINFADQYSDWSISYTALNSIGAVGGSLKQDPVAPIGGSTVDAYAKPTCLVFRWDSTTMTTDLWVNGVHSSSSGTDSQIHYSPNFRLFSTPQTSGRAQELRVWKTPLTDENVAAYYNAGKITTADIDHDNTVAVYHLLEGSGHTIQNEITTDFLKLPENVCSWDSTNLFDM